MATPKYDKKTKTWSVRATWREDDKLVQKYMSGFLSQMDALEWHRLFLQKRTSSYCGVDTLLYSVIATFMDEKQTIDKIAPASVEFYNKYFKIITSHFHNIDINDISVMSAQRLINSNSTTTRKCKGIKQVLSALFNYAERVDILDKNIIKKIKTPTYTPKETPHYNAEQFKNLLCILRNDDHHLLVPIIIMGTCGLRPSEVEALVMSDLTDLSINVNKSVCFIAENGSLTRIVKATKTKKSNRVIRINQKIYNEIIGWRTRHSITSDILVCKPNNEPYSKETLCNALKDIINKYKLPKITPYGIRHTFGQLQKSIGTDIYTISSLMGHSTIQITANTYLHKDSTLESNAMDKHINMLL